MPSCTTHYIHSNEVYKILNKETKKDIEANKDIYNLFAQSHDYFYYSFNKDIKDIGFQGHHYYTRDFLINIIKYIKDNKLQNNKQTLCCLYGYITHYVLDSICHPFIFYKTGVYRHNKETKKYKGLHAKMENDIDSIYYEKYYHKKYNGFNISKEVIKKPNWNTEVTNLLNHVYSKTYNIDNIEPLLKKCVKQMKLTTYLTSKDRIGLKLSIFTIVDVFTKGQLASYSTHHKPNIDYLNKEHKEWTNPCYKEITSNKSFDELFDEATKKAAQIIETAHNYLFNNKSFKTLDIITNLDYASGIDIDKDKRMEYFEF
ncbi:MAG: zinc dependent phospholipase C family protein [Bacilli bacterium]|nr:zinc dependent phospholipase C family protein [Bacilli bacterium]